MGSAHVRGHLNMKTSYGDKQEGGIWKQVLCPILLHIQGTFFPVGLFSSCFHAPFVLLSSIGWQPTKQRTSY